MDVEDKMEQGERHHMSSDQAQIIISYMQGHSQFASNKLLGADAKNTKRKMWAKLAEAVSQKGHPKTIQQLQNFWQKLRLKAKKYRADKLMSGKTGNKQDTIIPLNPMLEQVLAIVGTSHGNGLAIVEEVGIRHKAVIKSTRQAKIMKMNTKGVKSTPSSTITNRQETGPRASSLGVKFIPSSTITSAQENGPRASSSVVGSLQVSIQTGKTPIPSTSYESSTPTTIDCSSPAGHVNPARVQNRNLNKVVYIAPSIKNNEKENIFKKQYASYSTAWATKPNQTILRSQETLLALENNSNAMNEMSSNLAKLTEANIQKNNLLEKQVQYLKEIYELKREERNLK